MPALVFLLQSDPGYCGHCGLPRLMVTHYRWRFAQFAVLASLIETLLKIQPILAWILDILA